MSNKPSIYAHCPAGCEWETVHKEDLEDGTFKPLSSQGVNNLNDNTTVKKWVGTQAQYDAEFGDTPPVNTEVTITDDTDVYVSSGNFSQDATTEFGDYIIPKKKLLWSGNINISMATNFKLITSFTESLVGKKIEIELSDQSQYVFEPIVLTLRDTTSTQLYEKEIMDFSSFVSYNTANGFKIGIKYYNLQFSAYSRQNIYKFSDHTCDTSGYNCYVTAIYEIVE